MLSPTNASGRAPGRRPPGIAFVTLCDACIVLCTLVLLCIALAWGSGGAIGGSGHHHVVHGSEMHNRTEVDEAPRFDNALDGGGVVHMVHVHYLNLGIALACVTVAQHVWMITRRSAMVQLLTLGIGAETTVHTLAMNSLSTFLCAEISGIADVYHIVVVSSLHVLSLVLVTAVLLHSHGLSTVTTPTPALCSSGRGTHQVGTSVAVSMPPSLPLQPNNRAGGTVKDNPGLGLRWFYLCPLRRGVSHPPAFTTMLATTVRAVAVAQCLLPWAWVAVHYGVGITSSTRPDVTIMLLPPILLFLNSAKVVWMPGVAWARTQENTRRLYGTEALFDLMIVFSTLFCAMVDLLMPAGALVHSQSDGDAVLG